nr:MAG TPA: hypothetical protein [Caudoviricetes sp.]
MGVRVPSLAPASSPPKDVSWVGFFCCFQILQSFCNIRIHICILLCKILFFRAKDKIQYWQRHWQRKIGGAFCAPCIF